MRFWLAIVAAGCAGATVTAPPHALGAPGKTPAPSQPFADKPPGPIAGSFRVSCAENEGEIIEFTVDKNKAVGKVVDPGAAKRFGFQKGEEVMRLTADSYGDWLGEVHFRSVSGAQHWDGIRLVATDGALNATMTNEPCYRNMSRVK